MSDTHKNWGHPRHFQMFSEQRNDLAREIPKHPELVELLQKHPQEEFEMLLAEIACYCEVVLKGDYMPEDLDNLCGILYRKLQFKRTGIEIALMNPTREQ